MEKERFFTLLTRGAFAVLLLASVYAQVVRYPYYRGLVARYTIRPINEGTPRGEIRDRNDRVLVRDVECFNLIFFPQALTDPEVEAEEVARLAELEPARVRELFTRKYRNPFDQVVIRKRISEEQVARIAEHDLPGVQAYEGRDREYVLGTDFAHVTGYVGEVSPEQLARLRDRGFVAGDTIGQEGLEKQYDDDLRGVSGGTLVRVDALGRPQGVIGRKPKKLGNSIMLTIDQTLQEIASEELGSRRGCVVALDPASGQVLALVSKPAYDPGAVEKALLRPEGNPFLNRVTQGAYPPGSVFKVITEIALLESGLVDEHDRVECPGFMEVGTIVFHCHKDEGHGWVDINLALPFSCNIYFATMGLKVGQEKIVEYARLFRLGSTTGVDLPGERPGIIPAPSLPAELSGGPLNLSIGQGRLTTTPLQLASLIATVANGGNIWRPFLVRRVVNEKNETVKETTPVLNGTVAVSPETMDILRRGLRNVVVFGTGVGAAVPGIAVAGKTGTAQRASIGLEAGTHGAFGCYAPAESPSLALVVYLDSGASGEAARIAGRVIKRAFTASDDETAAETEVVPEEDL